MYVICYVGSALHVIASNQPIYNWGVIMPNKRSFLTINAWTSNLLHEEAMAALTNWKECIEKLLDEVVIQRLYICWFNLIPCRVIEPI